MNKRHKQTLLITVTAVNCDKMWRQVENFGKTRSTRLPLATQETATTMREKNYYKFFYLKFHFFNERSTVISVHFTKWVRVNWVSQRTAWMSCSGGCGWPMQEKLKCWAELSVFFFSAGGSRKEGGWRRAYKKEEGEEPQYKQQLSTHDSVKKEWSRWCWKLLILKFFSTTALGGSFSARLKERGSVLCALFVCV